MDENRNSKGPWLIGLALVALACVLVSRKGEEVAGAGASVLAPEARTDSTETASGSLPVLTSASPRAATPSRPDEPEPASRTALEIRPSLKGALSGVVLDDDGAPIASMNLKLARAGEEGRAMAQWTGDRFLRLMAERGAEDEGPSRVLVRTDAQGGFSVEGLAPGGYHVWVGAGGFSTGYDQCLTRHAAPADGRCLTLVWSLPYLVLQFLDADGLPWEGEPIVPERIVEGGLLLRSWPDVPRVELRAIRTIGDLPLEGGIVVPPCGEYTDGRVRYALSVGGEYVLSVLGGPFRAHSERIRFDAATRRIDREFRLVPLSDFGSVLLDPAYSMKPAMIEDVRQELVIWFVREPHTRKSLLSGLMTVGDPIVSLLLPPGRYDIGLQGSSGAIGTRQTAWNRRCHGSIVSPIDLGVADSRVLHPTLDRGGRLSIQVDASCTEGRACSDFTPLELHLRSLRGDVEWVVHQLQGELPELGPHLSFKWSRGLSQTSEVLPTGRHELIAVADGRVVSRQWVELEEGQVTPVHVAH